MYRPSRNSDPTTGCFLTAIGVWFFVSIAVLGAIGFVAYKILTHFGIL